MLEEKISRGGFLLSLIFVLEFVWLVERVGDLILVGYFYKSFLLFFLLLNDPSGIAMVDLRCIS